MRRRLAAFSVLLLGVVANANAGWIHDVRHATGSLPEASSLRYETAPAIGTPHFSDALQSLADANGTIRLDLVVLHTRVLEADLQHELVERLRTSAPHQLDAALRSSGNHDNPAMLALTHPFRQSILDSSVVAGLRDALGQHGLRIGSVVVEKLTLEAADGTSRLRCFLWLVIQPS